MNLINKIFNINLYCNFCHKRYVYSRSEYNKAVKKLYCPLCNNLLTENPNGEQRIIANPNLRDSRESKNGKNAI